MIDAKALRGALGSFATGVTIVTTNHEGRNVGLTANSFNSVSLDPPLVLWSLAKKSSNIDAFMNTGAFAVHILSSDQEDLSNRFATPGIDKFEGIETEGGRDDVPLLRDCAARFECQTAYRYDGGDHIIFVGEVLELSHSEKEPLLFHQGKYARKTGQSSEQADENRRDLNYLIARSYFLMTDSVRREAKSMGVTQADHYAMSVLMKAGAQTLDAVNDVIADSGRHWTTADIDRLTGKGSIVVSDEGIIDLTRQGRESMIELFALAKATEAQAQKAFPADELDQLRALLSHLVDELDRRSDGEGARHLEAMNALQSDQN